MNYTLVSGYYDHPDAEFTFSRWVRNTFNLHPQPQQIFVICNDKVEPSTWLSGIKFIALNGNLGHVGSLLNGSNPHHLCGWSASILTGAMLAYTNCTDFVYQEGDVLCYGPVIETLYKDCEGRQAVFGQQSQMVPCAQSLFLVKHAFIPEFCRLYLEEGDDRRAHVTPEHKFDIMKHRRSDVIGTTSFGIDRERPDGWIDQRPMYVQHLTAGELEALRERNMI